MLVAPIVKVRREEGRLSIKLNHCVKLVLTNGLSMDGNKTAFMFFSRGCSGIHDSFNEFVDGLISIAVSNDIVVLVVDFEEKSGENGVIREVIFPTRFVGA